MRIILINILTLCCLLAPQLLFAGGEAMEFVMTPRAQKIFEQAPKTPEELLTVIKEFMDNPDMNGYKLGERVSGIDKEYWGEPSKVIHKNSYFLMYSPSGPHSPYYFRNPQLTPPTAYAIAIKVMQDHSLLDLSVGRAGEQFCISPLIVQKILGKPTKIKVMSPCFEPVIGYNVFYFYRRNGYEVRITYPAKNIPFNYEELCGSGFARNTEKRWKTRKELISFANHKSLCAVTFRIYRENHTK